MNGTVSITGMGILCAIGNEPLRQKAAEQNRQLIMTRAEKSVVSATLAAFYRQLSNSR